jgi:hypothetical protein
LFVISQNEFYICTDFERMLIFYFPNLQNQKIRFQNSNEISWKSENISKIKFRYRKRSKLNFVVWGDKWYAYCNKNSTTVICIRNRGIYYLGKLSYLKCQINCYFDLLIFFIHKSGKYNFIKTNRFRQYFWLITNILPIMTKILGKLRSSKKRKWHISGLLNQTYSEVWLIKTTGNQNYIKLNFSHSWFGTILFVRFIFIFNYLRNSLKNELFFN